MSYCKYRRKRKQHLKDGVWYDYSPQVYAKGQLVGCGYAECADSPDTPPITPPDGSKYKRWVTMTDDYYCELGDKYYKMKLQVSNDNINWVDANPPEYKKGNLWEAQSADCGADNPEEWKFYANICIKGDLYEQEQLYVYGEPTGELRVGKLVERNSDQCFIWKPVEGEYICEEYKETKTNEFEYSGCDSITYFINDKVYGQNYHPVKLKSRPYKSLKFFDFGFENINLNECITSLILNEIDTIEIDDMGFMFRGLKNLILLDVSTFDTSNVSTMESLFDGCSSIPSLDLSSFKTDIVRNMANMFRNCNNLTNIILSSFNTGNVETYNDMFNGCDSLNHIKCKQSFKDWCIQNQNMIKLPTAMREGGSGTWEIVG